MFLITIPYLQCIKLKNMSATKMSLTTATILSFQILSGCISNNEKADAPELQPQALSKSDIQALLISKTYPFSKGGIYFSSESTATAIWVGETEDTTWYARDDSSFCYTLDLFGGEEECIGLVKNSDGSFTQHWNGSKKIIKPNDINEGRTF